MIPIWKKKGASRKLIGYANQPDRLHTAINGYLCSDKLATHRKSNYR